MKLRGQELDVWNATYASAIVALWLDPRNEKASDGAKAVRAIEFADFAVRQLRDRRAHGDPRAGKSVLD